MVRQRFGVKSLSLVVVQMVVTADVEDTFILR
jgi:hypothetical protein